MHQASFATAAAFLDCCGVSGEMRKISLRIFQKRHGIAICPACLQSASAALRGMRRLSPLRQTPAGKIFMGSG